VVRQSPDAWAEALERALDEILDMPRTSDSRSVGTHRARAARAPSK
jgi:hypothetical protein